MESWTWGGGGEVDMGGGWRGGHGVGVERWTWGGGGEADMGRVTLEMGHIINH